MKSNSIEDMESMIKEKEKELFDLKKEYRGDAYGYEKGLRSIFTGQ